MKAYRIKHQSGGAALAALVCLSIIALIVAGLLRVSQTRSDQLLLIERRCQTDWLVEAGLERAVAQIRLDPSYAGETWSIPAESLTGRAASVVITVSFAEINEPGPIEVQVEVQADYPADGSPIDRVRRNKRFPVQLSQPIEESLP